ncbi:MAG: hypothetical protein II767_00895, partial [Proteobacteria bacterium]|nr:hypothetical protein [Pseudomonadota bacterium]
MTFHSESKSRRACSAAIGCADTRCVAGYRLRRYARRCPAIPLREIRRPERLPPPRTTIPKTGIAIPTAENDRSEIRTAILAAENDRSEIQTAILAAENDRSEIQTAVLAAENDRSE